MSSSTRRTSLALLVAVLDEECTARVPALLCLDDDPHLAAVVAHDLAHLFVRSIDEEDHQEMRDDLQAELLALAGDG